RASPLHAPTPFPYTTLFRSSALAPEAKPETILMRARRLGLGTSRLPSLDDGGEALRLAPINVEDLLLRPRVKIDYRRLEVFVQRSEEHTSELQSLTKLVCRL